MLSWHRHQHRNSWLNLSQAHALLDSSESWEFTSSHHLLSYFYFSESYISHIREGILLNFQSKSEILGQNELSCVSCILYMNYMGERNCQCLSTFSAASPPRTASGSLRVFFSPSARDPRAGEEWTDCCVSPVCLWIIISHNTACGKTAATKMMVYTLN